MAKEIKIDDVVYTVNPIPPHLSPFSARISELLQKKSASFEEATQISQDIAECMEVLLGGTVKPIPRLEHQTMLFDVLIDVTNETIEQAKFFRNTQGSSSTKGRSTRSGTPQTPK